MIISHDSKEGIEEMPSENYRLFFLVLCKRGRSKARLKIKHASINSVRREEGKSVNEKNASINPQRNRGTSEKKQQIHCSGFA